MHKGPLHAARLTVVTQTKTKPHPLTFFAASTIAAVIETVAEHDTIKLKALGTVVADVTGCDPKTAENVTRALDRYGWVTIVGSVKARDVTLTDVARRARAGEPITSPVSLGH